MPEIRTRALVLRSFDQGESDRLVRLYTESNGRVTAIAKGAKRSRRRFPGTLESLTVADVRIVDPPRSSLMRLEGARLVRSFDGLVDDLARYAIACQIVEALDRLTGEHEAHPGLFRFAVGALGVLPAEAPDRLLGWLVLAKTLAWLGYRPRLVHCAVCGGTLPQSGLVAFEPRHGGAVGPECADATADRVAAGLLRALDVGLHSPLRCRGELGIGPRQTARAEALLDRFFVFHTGIELRSTRFLRTWLGREECGDGWLDAPNVRRDTAPEHGGDARLTCARPQLAPVVQVAPVAVSGRSRVPKEIKSTNGTDGNLAVNPGGAGRPPLVREP